MKNKWIKLLGAVIVASAAAATVEATPISGSVGFTGTYTANGETTPGDISTAASMTINTASIASSTGAFNVAPVTLNSFVSSVGINPANTLLPNMQLWSITSGGIVYTLTVNTENKDFADSKHVDLSGNGTIHDGTTADDTAGTWELDFGNTGAAFTWQATSGNNIPDGGTTSMLLGGVLVGLGLIKRKLMA